MVPFLLWSRLQPTLLALFYIKKRKPGIGFMALSLTLKSQWTTWKTMPKLYTENARHKAYAFPGLTKPYMEENNL